VRERSSASEKNMKEMIVGKQERFGQNKKLRKERIR
jgi:hypothetical protein